MASSSASADALERQSSALPRNLALTSLSESGFSGPPFWYGKSALSVSPDASCTRTPPGKACGYVGYSGVS